MEYVLKADLFDYELVDKIFEAVLKEINQLEKESHYKIVISFHVDLLNEPRMDLVDVPLEKWKKNESREDKIYNLLGFQLDKIDEAFSLNGLKIIHASIEGDQLETPDIVKLQINSEDVELSNSTKKKNSNPIKLRTVMPSRPNHETRVSKLANEELSKIYKNLMKAIRDKKIMSEVLQINTTESNNELYAAFCEQYWDLWLCVGERRTELINILTRRIEVAVDRYLELERSNSNGNKGDSL
ncbi:hypothetical protein [Paenibacillus graminis]|uniref:hypothetical protein n=2 Tax=Paenibacillus graminis TaxID=189425 RepID=UPI002DB90BB5|nr:hypothetical protein [Paenibacillus graminis]MEC0172571.1 hypothetical protein [Paenibacillus graminis]